MSEEEEVERYIKKITEGCTDTESIEILSKEIQYWYKSSHFWSAAYLEQKRGMKMDEKREEVKRHIKELSNTMETFKDATGI